MTKGRYKYLHFVAVVSIVGVSGLLVGFQFALGGYSRTVAPIFCLGSPGSAFLFGVVPACLTSAIFLTFVMILLFKIIELKGWRLKSTVGYLQCSLAHLPFTAFLFYKGRECG